MSRKQNRDPKSVSVRSIRISAPKCGAATAINRQMPSAARPPASAATEEFC
ncbi:hypothetical protein ACQPTN_02045 [Bradyrhizobium sp. 13971]